MMQNWLPLHWRVSMCGSMAMRAATLLPCSLCKRRRQTAWMMTWQRWWQVGSGSLHLQASTNTATA